MRIFKKDIKEFLAENSLCFIKGKPFGECKFDKGIILNNRGERQISKKYVFEVA